jgi:glucokinase
MKFDNDQRVVMTLDAGGTNFVFSAIQCNREIVEPITLPSQAHDLPRCLETLVAGFSRIRESLGEQPAAISFAFPGPADYPAGIISSPPNLTAFRGGVAVGPMLQERFQLPVFLNNDGDLFAYGEAISGFLPYVNGRLREGGSAKQYRNLFGVTLGTGFGGGIVRNGDLFLGDNSSAAEIWVMRNKLHNASFVEEGASIRAVQRVYLAHSTVPHATQPTPKEIYEYACGAGAGDRQAAIRAFAEMGEVVGDALANAITLIDGLVVIGGGLSAAAAIFLPRLVEEMNGSLATLGGGQVDRMEIKAFNLEDEAQFAAFIRGEPREITVPGTTRKVLYDPLKRIGVGLSRLGTSRAVALGAYAFALHSLDTAPGEG